MVRVCAGDAPRAAAAALDAPVKLAPLPGRGGDRFTRSGGWTGWRVEMPARIAGMWIYTRRATSGSHSWPPLTWWDCIARHESLARAGGPPAADPSDALSDTGTGTGTGSGDIACEQRMERDQTVAGALLAAMGTGGAMDPFPWAGPRVGTEVLSAVVSDMRATYAADGPGTRVEPRGLSAVTTKVGVLRATEHLVEPHFIDRAERWLAGLAAAGESLPETDRLELRLLEALERPGLTKLLGFCAMAQMCDLDPAAARLWYRTGGDCSGHPDIRSYAVWARQELPALPPQRRKPARKPARKTPADARARLVSCGAPTLTGSICRHKVSPATPACPAGHPRDTT